MRNGKNTCLRTRIDHITIILGNFYWCTHRDVILRDKSYTGRRVMANDDVDMINIEVFAAARYYRLQAAGGEAVNYSPCSRLADTAHL